MNLPPLMMKVALPSLVALAFGPIATAQHHSNQKQHAQGQHQGGMPGMVPPQAQQPTPRQQQQIYQQQAKEYQQQLAHQQQQHQEHIQRFEAWRAANGGSQAGSAGSGGIPTSPEALQPWLWAQKHNKALKKSYDPAYDDYLRFSNQGKPSKALATSGGQATAAMQPGTAGSAATSATAKTHHAGNNHALAATPTTPAGSAATTQQGQEGSTGQAGAKKPHHADAGHALVTTTATGIMPRGVAVGTARHTPDATDNVSISTLRTVLIHLKTADHDYDGHRIDGMHAIRRAIEHLGSNAPPVAAGMGPGNLPQAKSDAILRDAVLKLKNVESRLGTAGLSEHHGRARSEVAHAIRQLHVALEIR